MTVSESSLPPGVCADLNRRYYNGHPDSYLSLRLISLLNLCRQEESCQPLATGEFVVGRLRITQGQLLSPEERLSDYTNLEAIVLSHHACEALFRQYFAHVGRPDCPWMVARRLPYGPPWWNKIKKLVESLDEPDVRANVLQVFRGYRDYAEASAHGYPNDEAEWNAGSEALADLLHHAASRLDDEQQVYNAAKHGLAVVPAEQGVAVHSGGSGPMIDAHGPTVQTIYQTDDKQYKSETYWVNRDRTIAVTHMVIAQIKALFDVARVYYLGPAQPLVVATLTPEQVQMVTTLGRVSGRARRLRSDLLDGPKTISLEAEY